MEKASKILVLVEGARTDVRLMEHLFIIYGISDKYEIVSYNTNIYVLYDDLFEFGDPSVIDLLQLLKAREPDAGKKDIFNHSYSDILLIFDLDPQDPQYTPEKVSNLVEYFVESSDMGKLYLNYPMIEAFYHMKSIPDPNYNDYIVTLQELHEGSYKQRVNQENRNRDYKKFAATREECNIVIQQNIDKAWYIADLERMDGQIHSLPDFLNILNKQLDLLTQENLISVLCTCVFYISEYNPKLLDKP